MNLIGKKVSFSVYHQTIKEIVWYDGVFLQFGIDFDELEEGIAHFSTAIVMNDDGQIHNVPVENVVFEDSAERIK